MLKYRPEIDGLRTIAVIPVILYHAGFELFSGGFVGVDIFFVISGYLITGILIRELNEGSFSILSFYERRARRILPAILIVMLVCLPLGWHLMLPDPFENFAQSVVATIFFSNNILLNMTSGYWDLATEFKPLVHTWSLAIEEQYYFIIPAILYVSWNFFKLKTIWVITILMFLSFAACQYYMVKDSNFTFYMLPTRAWELLIGSFIAFISFNRPNQSSNMLAIVGLILIAISIFGFDHNTPFPSFYAIFPTVGTALVLVFGAKETFVAKLLSYPLLVWIGLISYSLYLWHQPLFAFARINSFEEPSTLTYSTLIAITFILSYLTWRFIEKPFRNKEIVKLFSFSSTIIGSTVTLLFCSLIVYKAQGFPSRFFNMENNKLSDF